MPHFFIKNENINDNFIDIKEEELLRHLVNSRRVKIGESVIFIDENEIQYHTKIELIEKKNLKAKIIEKYKSKRIPQFNISLGACILSSDDQNSLISMATQLGVKEIYPIISDNVSLKKEIAQKKLEKWQKVAAEASKQCERSNIPSVLGLIKFDDVFDLKFDEIIIFAEKDTQMNLKQRMKNIDKNSSILILIGPEGGFSAREFEVFDSKKIEKVTLGNLILKADTAACSAISNVIYELSI